MKNAKVLVAAIFFGLCSYGLRPTHLYRAAGERRHHKPDLLFFQFRRPSKFILTSDLVLFANSKFVLVEEF